MDFGTRERVNALRREIAEIQMQNRAHLPRFRPDSVEPSAHEKRAQRLREIMEELRSMTGRKNLMTQPVAQSVNEC